MERDTQADRGEDRDAKGIVSLAAHETEDTTAGPVGTLTKVVFLFLLRWF